MAQPPLPGAAGKILHHERVTAPGAAPSRWLLVLHGVYGAGRNWATVMRRFVRERPQWGALLVDLRQHGGSQGFPPPHTLAAAAADLDALVAAQGVAAAGVLGHSFGGKVALSYLRAHGAELDQVWVVDSTPARRAPGGSAWDVLEIVRSLPDAFETRAAGVAALEAAGLARPVAQWLATNLEQRGGVYRWRFELAAIEELLRDFFATDLWRAVEAPPGSAELHFVKAAESSVLDARAAKRIERAAANGRVFLHHVAGGHWVNADNPDGLLALMLERF